MKKSLKLFCLLLSLATFFSAAACGAGESVNTGTDSKINSEIESENKMKLENITPLNERQNVEKALCGTDALGREITPAGEENGRLVGLFYTLWLGNYFSDEGESYFGDTILDLSKMDFNYVYSGGGSPFVKMHYYAEPLFGYYNQRDIWVVERHVQMFIAAGIDFLGIDATNNDYYPVTAELLLQTLDRYYRMGYKVPQIMFLTNTSSADRVNEIYEFLYKDDRYKHLWFNDSDGGKNPDGKPWITMRSDEKIYLKSAIRNKFYMRDSQWPNEKFLDNGFPWIEFTRPQPVHNGIISVSVAQNNGMHMSDSVQYEKSPNGIDYYNSNRGRGYSSVDNVNSKSRVNEGSNFEEQWDVAVNSDARIAFVLEWNEWAALKLATNVEGVGNTVVFFDCASVEFSRDIEPIKGYYGDNYYMQLIRNVRRFKNSVGNGIDVDTVSLKDGNVDWNSVSSGVGEFTVSGNRDFENSVSTDRYVNDTLQNDIQEIRLAQDENNVYILVTTKNDVVKSVGDRRMNIRIKNDGETSSASGYDYVINRYGDNGKVSIEKIGESGMTIVGYADCYAEGKYIQFAVPKNIFAGSFQLKLTDNVDLTSDIMNSYTTGDSAPYGRLNYKFNLNK